MANEIVIEGKCPNCDADKKVSRVEIINTAQDTGLKEALLSGEYFSERCDACGENFTAATPLIYYDPNLHTMIQFVPGRETDEALLIHDIQKAFELAEIDQKSRFTRRVVREVNLLIEKMHLLDAGLDDRVVELVKAVALQSHQDYLPDVRDLRHILYIPGKKKENSQLVFLYKNLEEVPAMDFSRELYDQIGMYYFERVQALGDLTTVDLPWAIEFLKKAE